MLELVGWTTKTPFVSTHGKMELVQQLSKTLSLVMFAIIIVTQGEKGKGARHENTSVIKMTLSCFLSKHTAPPPAAAPTLSSRTQTSRAAASLSPSRRKL